MGRSPIVARRRLRERHGAGWNTDTEAVSDAQAERFSWLPDQFQTPEMLAKSWEHASKKLSEMGQDNKALRDENEAITAQLESLLVGRNALEDRLAVLERGLLQRLVGRRAGAQ